MKYHSAIQAIQDAIEILGDTLQIADVQRKYGFEELRAQALEEVLSLAAECPENERSVWASATLHFADLNSQLAELGVAPLALPSCEDFMQLLEGWRLRHADEAGPDVQTGDVPVVGSGSDFFATLVDPELEYAERVSRVMARMRQQKQIEVDSRQPAPVVIALTDKDKLSVEFYVRLAVAAKGIEEKSFRLLLQDIGDKYSWRFDEAAEAAWHAFFSEEVAKARSANAA